MTKKLLIVDFDGTITDFQTPDDFVCFCIRQSLKKRFLYSFKRKLRFIIKTICNKFKFSCNKLKDKIYYLRLLKGYTEEYIKKCAYEYYNTKIVKHLRLDVIEEINRLRDVNTDVIILSAGYHEYIKLLNKNLDYNLCLSSKFQLDNGILNGKYDRSVYGIDKLDLVTELKVLDEYNKENIFCFTDSISDSPLFKVCGNIIAVYPDDDLRKLSKRNNWKVIG